MICIIRIRGEVNMDRNVGETLSRLRMRRKYSCVVLNPNKVQEGMIKKVKDLVAFGTISKDTLEKLIEKRWQPIDKKKKVDAKKVVEELEKGKGFSDVGLKPFFRLHPPRKGI